MKSWYRDSLSFHLLRAARLHRTRAASLLAEIGLHPGQETVLQLLSDVDGQSMSDLADAMGVQPPTVTKMIARMGAQGLVKRDSSDDDGRRVRVYLTEDGKACAGKLKTLWKGLEREATVDLEKADRKKLAGLLKTVSFTLQPQPEEPNPSPKSGKKGKPRKKSK